MRVQQQRQSVRMRIGEEELATLLAGETVTNAICWPDGQREHQHLRLDTRIAWQRESDGWCLSVPGDEVRALADRLPSREGLAWTLTRDAATPALEIRFDVDVRDSTRKRHRGMTT